MPQDRTQWPTWVRFGLWGLPSRGWAWAFYWLCLFLAGASFGLGFVYPVCFVGCLFFFSAFMYQQSIRWVDRAGGWKTTEPEERW